MTITTEQLARLRELEAKATPGPWLVESKSTMHMQDKTIARCEHMHVRTHERCVISPPDNGRNAALIVEMRNNLGALLDDRQALAESLVSLTVRFRRVRGEVARLGEAFLSEGLRGEYEHAMAVLKETDV